MRVVIIVIVIVFMGCEPNSRFPVMGQDITVGPLFSYLQNPVLSVSSSESAFDHKSIFSVGVVNINEHLVMYYTAISKSGMYSIGRAESTDGINWIKNDNPVITPDENNFDEIAVLEPFPLYDGEKVNLFFISISADKKYRIMIATSTDTINFFREETELVNMSGGDLGIRMISEPSVIFEEDGLIMYFSGSDEDNRGYVFSMRATFDNPLLWTSVQTAPVFLPHTGDMEAFDQYSVGSPSLLKVRSANGRELYRMYYSGSATKNSSFHLGLAGSFDGKSFERYIYNPVLHYGRSPSAIVFRNNLYVYYNELPPGESHGISVATTKKITNE